MKTDMITVKIDNGKVFRLLTLMTHYRQPLDFSATRMAEARRVLERWFRAATPNDDGPPIEILSALCEDLNTPKAIAAMHVFRKNDGAKLYASMRFLGLLGDNCLPDDWRMIPEEHLKGAVHGPAVTTTAQ